MKLWKIKYKISDLRFRFHIWLEIKRGFVAKDGTPLKCHKCKSTETENFNEYWEEVGCVEYSTRCKNCKTILGHWAYGCWEL